MPNRQQLQHFIDAEQVQITDLNNFFDTLPAVAEIQMIGDWQGGVFKTGHPGESQLLALNWAGKCFRNRNDVDPIVSLDAQGKRFANSVMGSATLRTVEYRGVATATMVYDKHPIFDHFRQVDTDTLLGVMDRKGDAMPLYFYLSKV